MFWSSIGVAVAAVQEAVDKEVDIDISERYKAMDNESKCKLIKGLRSAGISQRVIAKTLGISPSAVSQRLKGNELTTELMGGSSNLNRLLKIREAGLSDDAISKVLSSGDTSITQEEIASFFKVLDASKNSQF